jgi:hypothetical protein
LKPDETLALVALISRINGAPQGLRATNPSNLDGKSLSGRTE